MPFPSSSSSSQLIRVVRVVVVVVACLSKLVAAGRDVSDVSVHPTPSDARLIFQTSFGRIELAFYPDLAPVTCEHILKLGAMGAYTSNHFFRVDKGFVAQVADVVGGRTVQLDSFQINEAKKNVPGEFSRVPHRRGSLSMGRYDDPDSGTSSFSILLGNAPHLDGTYTLFGTTVSGDDVLAKMEHVETTRQGILVMPAHRINIDASYVATSQGGALVIPNMFPKTSETNGDGSGGTCPSELAELRQRVNGQREELQRVKSALASLHRDQQTLRQRMLP